MSEPSLTEQLCNEAEADMRHLGLNPASPEEWKLYALCLLKDRGLLRGLPKPDDDEIIEMSKASHERLKRFAGRMVRLVAKLREVEKNYLKIKVRSQKDVLEHAIALLTYFDDVFDPFRVSALGGLPSALRLVQADLVNVFEGRLGRLVSPSSNVVAGARGVSDSRHDRVRLTIQAYSAAAVANLTKSGKSKEEAYRRVAQALADARFYPPGKNDTPYSKETIKIWYKRAIAGDAPFAFEFQQAAEAATAEPDELIEHLSRAARSLTFVRDAAEVTS